VFEPIPAVLFGLFGAWVGHKLGRHWAQPALDALHVTAPTAVLDALRTWGPIAVGALAGLLLGFSEFVSSKRFGRPVNWNLTWFFRAFERAFDYSVGAYTRTVSKVLRVSAVALMLYGGLLALTWWSFTNTPTGFIPAQDKGYLLVNVQLPDAAAMPRTA